MRDPRFRFSDDVRSATRALAARTSHSGTVAASAAALAASIEQADDLREQLIAGGYGSAFDAAELFPLYESQVAKRRAATPERSKADRAKWLWIGVVVVIALIAVAILLGGGTRPSFLKPRLSGRTAPAGSRARQAAALTPSNDPFIFRTGVGFRDRIHGQIES